MGRSLEAMTAILGIIRAGAAYLPLDPADPPARLETLVRVSGCALIVADQEGFQALASLRIRPLILDAQVLADTPGSEPLPPVPGGQAPAYVLFTSGSTGEPKGVEVPHQAVLRLVLSGGVHAPLASDHVLQAAPLSFDASTLEIWGALLRGARLCLADKDELLAPGGLARIIAKTGTTFMWLTASLCHRLAESAPDSFRPLRVLLTGGETLSPPHMRRILEACPGLTLVNGYGPTENTTFTTTHHLSLEDTASAIPIGQPIPNTKVYILDHCDQPAPLGVWGEIAAGGDGLALGYLGRPDLTAASFVSLPALPGQRLYRTGDIGRWRADGVIEFRGRRDGQIKIRGYRVEPEEVEATLQQSPGVLAAAVVAEGAGEQTRLTACLIIEPGFDAAALIADLRKRLPAFMVPGRLVSVESIPTSDSGKTDRKRLGEIAAHAPELRAEKAFVPPATESERIVANAFAQIFRLERVSQEDNFYDLGGHSLMAARIVAMVAKDSGATLPLGEIFRRPTLRALASLLEELPKGGQGIPALPLAPSYAVSHAQQRLYFLHQMPGGDTSCNMPFVFEFGEDFDPRALSLALADLIQRHEGLRTSFIEKDGQPRQVIAETVETPLSSLDLSSHPDPRGEALRQARRQISTAFDLAQAPLFRVHLYDLGGGSCLALLVMHHIIGDGWSMQVLFRELSALYDAHHQGKTMALSPLTIQYKDYAQWQLSQDLAAHAAYWRAKLAGAPPRVELPHDRAAGDVRSFRGDSLRRHLDQRLSVALFAAAREAGATLANLMMALFASLLYRLTRQEDMVLGLGIAGRNHPEIEGVAGFFMNVLPIRLRLDEDLDFSMLVKQVQEVALEAFDRQEYSFDLLVRDLAPPRVANGQPLINVMFEYQDFSPLDPDGTAAAGSLASRPIDDQDMRAVESGTAKYDLTMFVLSEPDERLQLRLEYDTDLFDAQTASDYLDYLTDFARVVAGVPSTEPPSGREAGSPAPADAEVLP
jgi:amino acid adenylation domain-containing protein